MRDRAQAEQPQTLHGQARHRGRAAVAIVCDAAWHFLVSFVRRAGRIPYLWYHGTDTGNTPLQIKKNLMSYNYQ